MFTKGIGKDKLISTLGLMEELTNIDRVVLSKQQMRINAEMIRGKLHWMLEADSDAFNSTHIIRKDGVGSTALEEALNEVDIQKKTNRSIVILALVETKPERNPDGSIKTVWMSIDPCTYGMGDEYVFDRKMDMMSIRYPVFRLNLTEAEFKCCKSKLAFYDEFDDILYPILPCAYKSFTKSASTAFTHNEVSPIASAMILADSFLDSQRIRDLQFVYRTRTKKVKPLVSVVNKKTELIPQLTIANDVYELIRQNYICNVSYWTVTDEGTNISFDISTPNPYYQLFVQLSMGYGNEREAISIAAYARAGKKTTAVSKRRKSVDDDPIEWADGIDEKNKCGYILLKKNSVGSYQDFKKSGIKGLFDGIFHVIEAFENSFDRHSEDLVMFDEDIISNAKVIIGKKRLECIKIPEKGTYSFANLFFELISLATWPYDFSSGWAYRLSVENAHIYNAICNEMVIPFDYRGKAKKRKAAGKYTPLKPKEEDSKQTPDIKTLAMSFAKEKLAPGGADVDTSAVESIMEDEAGGQRKFIV